MVIVTGSRADYGILEPLIQKISDDSYFDMSLIVTGSHFKQGSDDDIKFEHTKIHCNLQDDSAVGISKSMGLAQISFCEACERLKPELVILLGDRFEIMAAATAAHIGGFPVAHIHGGEVTLAAYDDSFRHSITKMSSLHFVAAEEYRQRVIQLGENPDTVFNVGALGCDGLVKRKSQPDKPFYIVIWHPETIGGAEIHRIRIDISNAKVLFIGSGYDKGCAGASFKKSVKHLSRGTYLEYLYGATAIIGNSSSGIIEAPALGVPTINVGERQTGRLKAASIIDCQYSGITDAIQKVGSEEFQSFMQTDYHCPYGGGGVAGKIIETIKQKMPIKMRKGFYDLP